MIVGGKQKQKIGSNPNGLLWSQDQGNKGRDMLKKLGWTEGSGIGKHEQGINEPIKASKPIDRRGVGCDSAFANGTTHQAEYDEILKQLNLQFSSSGDEPNPSLLNLEDLSKKSRTRFHYSRHIRGKDLSCRTAEELACVILKPQTKHQDKANISTNNSLSCKDKLEETSPKEGTDEIETYSESMTFTFNSQVSMADYFKTKMNDLKRKNGNSLVSSKKETEEPDDSLQTSVEQSALISRESKKSKSSAKNLKNDSIPVATESVADIPKLTNNICGNHYFFDYSSEKTYDIVIKKSKKKKKLNIQEADNQTLVSNDNIISDNYLDSQTTGSKRKSRKREGELEVTSSLDSSTTTSVEENNVQFKPKKIKKHKVSKKFESENHYQENSTEFLNSVPDIPVESENTDCHLVENVKKKRKKSAEEQIVFEVAENASEVLSQLNSGNIPFASQTSTDSTDSLQRKSSLKSASNFNELRRKVRFSVDATEFHFNKDEAINSIVEPTIVSFESLELNKVVTVSSEVVETKLEPVVENDSLKPAHDALPSTPQPSNGSKRAKASRTPNFTVDMIDWSRYAGSNLQTLPGYAFY